jgi:hypothetical protein
MDAPFEARIITISAISPPSRSTGVIETLD